MTHSNLVLKKRSIPSIVFARLMYVTCVIAWIVSATAKTADAQGNGKASSLDSPLPLQMARGDKVDLNGVDRVVRGLSGEAGSEIINTGNLPAKLTIQSIQTDEIFGGDIREIKPKAKLSITKTGTGKLTLSGSNSYSGDTEVMEGILSQGKSNSFSRKSEILLYQGTELDLNGFDAEIGGLFGMSKSVGSQIVNRGATSAMLTIGGNNTNGHFAGRIHDQNAPLAVKKIGSGTQIFSGDHGYTGGTIIEKGRLYIGFDTPTGSISGNVRVDKDAQLYFRRANDYTFSGKISGEGTVVQEGDGVLTLAGQNDYSGDTILVGTTIKQAMHYALSPSSRIWMGGLMRGAVLDLGGFNGEIEGLIGIPNTKVINSALQSAELIINVPMGRHVGQPGFPKDQTQPAIDIFYGRIEDGKGGISLLKTGPGWLVLVGENSYTGGTIIKEGVLQIGKDGKTGSIKGDVNIQGTRAGLVFKRSNDYEFSGQISGAGVVLKSGIGRVTFTGENTYTGGTLIQQGSLQIGDGGETGSIQGKVIIDNKGAVLTDENGVALIDENKSGLVFNRSNSYTFEGEISGNGWIEKRGSGSLTLSGMNSYSGGTQIIEGTLIGTTSSLQGPISNNTTLIFDQDFTGDFNGSIEGAGEVVIKNREKGLINFNQDQPRIETLRIESGHVAVNARINSKLVTIENLGILSGAGTIAGVETQKLKVTNSGLVSPGNSIGTLSIKGDYTQTTEGKLLIEIAKEGHDKLDVEGKATLDGAIQVKTIDGYVPPGGQEYIVVEATEGVEGRFATEELEDLKKASLKLRVVYNDPDDEEGKGSNRVKVKTVQESFATTGTTASQKSVGKALDKAIETGKARDALGEAIWVMEFVPREMLGPYLEQLIPTMAISIKEVLFNAANVQYGQLSERLAAVREGIEGMSLNGLSQEPMVQQMNSHEARLNTKSVQSGYLESAPNSSWNLFANASGIFSKITSAADLPRQNAVTGYFSAGGDYRINQQISTGVYGGYQGIKSWYADGSRLRSNGVKFGFYGMGEWNHFYMNAMIGSGFHGLELKRTINMGAKQWTAGSRPTVWEINSLLGGGYELPVGPWRFGLNSSIQHTYLGISGFQENGGRNLGVRIGRQNPNSLVSTLGGSIAYRWELTPNYAFIPKVGLSWQHEFLNYGEKIPGAFLNGPGFQLTSADGARNNAFGTAGFMAQLGRRVGAYCYYNPQFGGGDILSHAVLIGLNVNF